jgi:hypothetical protein
MLCISGGFSFLFLLWSEPRFVIVSSTVTLISWCTCCTSTAWHISITCQRIVAFRSIGILIIRSLVLIPLVSTPITSLFLLNLWARWLPNIKIFLKFFFLFLGWLFHKNLMINYRLIKWFLIKVIHRLVLVEAHFVKLVMLEGG